MKSLHGLKFIRQANIIAGSAGYLRFLSSDELKGKVVITDNLSVDDVEYLRSEGVESLITLTPPWNDHYPFVGVDVLEAIFSCFTRRPFEVATSDDYMNLVLSSGLEPHITQLNKPRDVARFAFVIHPLSVDYIFNQPQFKLLRFVPHRLVERLLARIRPRYLSRITGIRSAVTGKEVEGFLIGLGATPRELRRRRPGFTYRRLIEASRMAQQMRAKIMGLGAFTKVVGDAGVTVAFKSDIAVTSGNSLTVSATLQAAKHAVAKMGGEIEGGRVVVIGATGSIGAVCSKILAQICREIILIALRPEKLISLKREIELDTKDVLVTIATDPNPFLQGVNLVVTATSAEGQKVIDVTKLEPGCVVCDVASPPDIKEEDAQRRPDVLVVEAGEILLPGKPNVGFNIGLPKGVVHACLAETALLAMEGRFDCFTLGHNIEIERVTEIYRLYKKHGVKLAGLRSFGRYITEDEIASKRKLADEIRYSSKNQY